MAEGPAGASGKTKPQASELGPDVEFMVIHAYCITYWAQIDEVLFDIFCACVGTHRQSAILYYRIDSMSARFSTVEELVKSVLPPKTKRDGGHDHPSVTAWIEARKGVDDLLTIRRRLAHQPLNAAVDIDPPFTTAGTFTINFSIEAGRHERARSRSAGEKPLGLQELRKHAYDLAWLRSRLKTFHADVFLKRFEASSPPTPPPS